MAESEIPVEETTFLVENLDAGNIVSLLDELEGSEWVDRKDNTTLYSEIDTAYQKADESMSDWRKKYHKALALAKLIPKDSDGKEITSKDFPFQGASTAMLPYILEAMLDFHGRAVPELVWAKDIVRSRIVGGPEHFPDQDIPPPPENAPPEIVEAFQLAVQEMQEQREAWEKQEQEKENRSERVDTFSNYQLQNDIPLWRESTDKALLSLPCVGTYYKKSYFNSDLDRICSDLKMADKIIFDIDECESFYEAENKFEKVCYSRNDLIAYIRGDQGWDIDEAELEKDKNKFEFIEAHCWMDLDEDGIKEPYTAILSPELQKIVCVYPDYDEEGLVYNSDGQLIKIEPLQTYTQTIFLPDPEGGPMGMGWGILLGPMFTAINKTLRDNLDAGTLNVTTSNSGLIAIGVGEGRGNRQQAGPIDIKMGQLTPVPMGGLNGSLAQNVAQFPSNGPSTTLFQIMEFMVESSRRMTTAAYQVDGNPGEAASLYLARLQQALKNPNSIVMRVYGAQRKEFEKIALLNYKHHDSSYYNKVLDLGIEANMMADFNPEDCDIEMVADPSQGSDIERVGKAQTVVDQARADTAAGIPSPINIRQAEMDLFDALQIANVDELLPEPDPGPSPQEQMLMEAQQAEIQFRERDMRIKEQQAALDEFKVQSERLKEARDAALELSRLGLEADRDEAEITRTYAEALAKLVKDAGLSYDQAKAEVIGIEEDFIDAEGGISNARESRPLSALNGESSRSMAQ